MTRDEILLKAEKYFPAQSGEAVDDNGDVYSTDDVEWPTKVGFLYGYREAEKDLALTPDDVWCIFNLVRDLQTKYSAIEGCLQEVANIFN